MAFGALLLGRERIGIGKSRLVGSNFRHVCFVSKVGLFHMYKLIIK